MTASFVIGLPSPRIAVLGLNPHAGDNGMMGDEEKRIIAPAIQQAQANGIQAHGPYAADGFFGSGAFKNFDGVLAMYHDQGLAPFKALSFGRGVNFTAGLPVVRTSPDHGTGFDIAGQGTANGDSFREAFVWPATSAATDSSIGTLPPTRWRLPHPSPSTARGADLQRALREFAA